MSPSLLQDDPKVLRGASDYELPDLVPLEGWGIGQEAYTAPSLLSKEGLQSLTSPPEGPVKYMCAHAPQSALSIPSALYSISFSR